MRENAWTFEDVVKVSAQAGFQGVETETLFLGNLGNPDPFQEVLQAHSMELGAVCLVEDWLEHRETEDERRRADRAIAFIRYFPGTRLVLCQRPGKNRDDLRTRQKNLIACIHEVARRAGDGGIPCDFHPNSPAGSVIRVRSDYDFLFSELDAASMGFAADAGHIAKGGMEVLEILQLSRSFLTHLHFKDTTRIGEKGQWCEMGKGSIDFPQIVEWLESTLYQGWVMVEDECDKARENPNPVVLGDGEYVEKLLRRKRSVTP